MNINAQATLPDEQKEQLKSIIGENYTIGAQLGRTGGHTIAYELTDKRSKEKKVLLCSHGQKTIQEKIQYKEQQEKSSKCRDFCAKGYNSADGCFLPETESYADGLYRITSYGGRELTEDLFSHLSKPEQQSIVRQFAGWLNFVHQKSFAEKDMLKSIFTKYEVGEVQQSDMWGDFTEKTQKIPFAQKVTETFAPYMSAIQQKQIQDLIASYQQRDKKDEICVLTHGDLRDANILYNSEKKQVSIIDFERSSVTSVYRDFCTYCRSGLAPEMIAQVVSAYNQLPKQQHAVHIDPKKVQTFLLIAYLHELTRCTQPESSKHNWNMFKKYYQQVNVAFNHLSLDNAHSAKKCIDTGRKTYSNE
ncbi:MAG: phosphotransferase [Alphaproteobacteria bacterium]|nr:phosphotransferase [Alphaproteobacteria bacterium]